MCELYMVVSCKSCHLGIENRICRHCFHVDCLWLDALYEDKAKRRVQRVLELWFGNESIFDVTLWWYNTQLYWAGLG